MGGSDRCRDGEDLFTADLCMQVDIWPQILVQGDVERYPPKYPTSGLAQFVIDNLDVTSFPSSVGPRRAKGKSSFQNYGIVPRKVSEANAELEEKDGNWSFHVAILRSFGDGIRGGAKPFCLWGKLRAECLPAQLAGANLPHEPASSAFPKFV
jgi:hypothetical protein